MCACESCSQIMKKCVMCRSQIELMVPLAVCSGGLGTISEVKADVEEEPKPSTSEAAQNQGPLMNNGGRDTNNSNDIQKLQQQLQDIKEQVSREETFLAEGEFEARPKVDIGEKRRDRSVDTLIKLMSIVVSCRRRLPIIADFPLHVFFFFRQCVPSVWIA